MEIKIKRIQISEDVEEQIRKVADKAFERAGIVSREAAFDDKKFNKAVKIAYKMLPMPVRLVVKKERFKGIMVEMRGHIFKSK